MSSQYEKICIDCGVIFESMLTQWCPHCYIANTLYRKFGCGQMAAARAVNKEVKKGRMFPANSFACVDCGYQATVYEHRDYNKPLDVVPTCQSCNLKRGPAIPKKMTFDEFLALAKKTAQWTVMKLQPEHFEPIRRKYFKESA